MVRHLITPNDWRKAGVCPIFKKGINKYQPCRYRPICVTSNILEQIMTSNAAYSLEKNLNLTTHQHGVRGGRWCEAQLIKLTA